MKTSKALRFDNFSPSSAKASKIASKIKSSDSKAEVLLRRTLWKLGLRYKKNVKVLPGKPDIVFPRERIVVFCDGDFWHGRNWEDRKSKLERGSNAPYWLSKIQANIDRDIRHNKELSQMGWEVLRFWETDVLEDVKPIANKIYDLLKSKRLFLKPSTHKRA